MSSEIVIQAEGLGKNYLIYKKPEDRLKQMILRWRRYFDEYWAVRGVDLVVRRGETIGIIGRNGSGKSTLLQMICGVLHPSAGTLQTQGRIAALLELGSGVNPEFSGRENIFFSASVLGLSQAEIEARFDSIAAFAGIGAFIDQPVKLYSSGMHARLGFAVAAHVDADILVVDEALAVGDAAFTQKCMRYIRKFRENGTLLFVSHDTASVINLCDRVIWMDRGQVRMQGPAKEVCQAYHASLEQESDDGSAFAIGGTRGAPPPAAQDVRHESLEAVHAQSIEVFEFNESAPWFGRRGASIVGVELMDPAGGSARSLSGGEELLLRVRCVAEARVESPIIGFFVRDRLGQNLFGDNTYLVRRTNPLSVAPGEAFQASFRFRMPYLPTGDYSIVAAIAEGTQETHVQHHWVDDAMFFRVHTSHVAQGLMGIPMLGIELTMVERVVGEPD